MKNFFIKYTSMLLLLCTIPIQTKNSISKISKKISTKATAWIKKTKETITHHEFNHVENLAIECLQGSVTIQTWKQPCVFVEFKKNGNSEFANKAILNSKRDGNFLKINTELIDKTVSGSLSLQIFVPQDLPLHVTTDHGTINVSKACGPLQLESFKGSMVITEGNNTVIAKTVHGTITIQRKKIKPSHALNITSTHGNIILAVPQNTNAEIEAHSKYGKIQSDIFVTLKSSTIKLNEVEFKKMPHHIHANIGQILQNNDPATILLSTESGNITISDYETFNALPIK